MKALIVLLDTSGSEVLMVKEQGKLFDFISTNVKEFETPKSAALSFLKDYLNVETDNFDLQFVRQESVTRFDNTCETLCILVGQLKEPLDIDNERLFWIKVKDSYVFLDASERNGSCYVYLKESCYAMLKQEAMYAGIG